MADQTTTPVASPCGAPSGGSGGGNGGGEGGAQGGGAQGMMGMLFPLAIFVLIFYFFIIRPQRKRQKQQDSLINGISRGDQVVTIGGFFGSVREVRDDSFLIEIADGVKVRILKSAVQTKRTSTSGPAPAPTLEKE
jgi:preprotein translocase subunit YajC